jgi:hypothetical protein
MCSKIESQEKQKVLLTGKKKIVEAVYGGDNSTNSENTNLDWRAIHIHGGMEHNLAKYAKYYFFGHKNLRKWWIDKGN